MSKLSENLKALRKRRNISQKAIAYMIYVSPGTYGYYERGGLEPNITTLIRLAQFYDITVGQLVGTETLNIGGNTRELRKVK
jgi:transcriptional regulator with XRE-family HTH domain